MANPPYSGFVIIVRENQDGGNGKAYVYADVPEGTPIPKGIIGIEQSLFSGLDTSKVPKDSYADRNFATRSQLKAWFGTFVDATLPDTPA